VLIAKSLKAEIHSTREQPNQPTQIKEIRWPGRGLMFTHTGNDRDVNLCVVCIPKGIEPTCPGGDRARESQANENRKGEDEN